MRLGITRKENEIVNLYVDGKRIVEVFVSAVRGNSVSLVFDADSSVTILRSEIDPNHQGNKQKEAIRRAAG